MLTLTFHTDPGHGWLEVDLDLVIKYNLKISRYSYVKGKRAFLEEDCDAPKLTEALRNNGVEFEYRELHTDRSHPIRNYNSFMTRGGI